LSRAPDFWKSSSTFTVILASGAGQSQADEAGNLVEPVVIADESPLSRRPEGDPGLADDVRAGHGPAVVRVVAVVAIIAEDEIGVGRDGLFVQCVGGRLVDVRLVEGDAVDVDHALLDFDGVAGQADDTLDVVLFRVTQRPEDDDIAALWLADVVGDLAHQKSLALVQAGLHTDTDDDETLDGGLNDQEDEQGEYGSDEDFAEKCFHIPTPL